MSLAKAKSIYAEFFIPYPFPVCSRNLSLLFFFRFLSNQISMSAEVATTSVTTMRTAQILLGLIIAPAKKDLLGMDTHAQVKKKTFNN